MARKSILHKLINLVFAAGAVAFLGYSEYGHLRLPASPMYDKTARFEKHYHFTKAVPFIDSYYLLIPDNYSPRYKYPLVLVLADAGEHAMAGYFLATDELRKSFPSFVVVPYASVRSSWATPPGAAYRPVTVGWRLPDAVPQAVEIVRDVERKYSVDAEKIYVTGHAAGATGVYGAVALYPGLFAAALPISGQWDPADAQRLSRTPIWAFHGDKDTQIPPDADRLLNEAVKKQGGHMTYTEIPDTGFDVWKKAYSEPGVWTWLFERKLHETAKPAHKTHR